MTTHLLHPAEADLVTRVEEGDGAADVPHHAGALMAEDDGSPLEVPIRPAEPGVGNLDEHFAGLDRAADGVRDDLAVLGTPEDVEFDGFRHGQWARVGTQVDQISNRDGRRSVHVDEQDPTKVVVDAERPVCYHIEQLMKSSSRQTEHVHGSSSSTLSRCDENLELMSANPAINIRQAISQQ